MLATGSSSLYAGSFSRPWHVPRLVLLLFGLVDFVIILLGTVMPVRFGGLSDPAVVHTLRAASSLRILRTCRLLKGRWDWKGGGIVTCCFFNKTIRYIYIFNFLCSGL